MASLLKDRGTPAGADGGAPGDDSRVKVHDLACGNCGSPLKRGQDWCLECGTAAPGRLGGRAGWRAAFTIVAVVLLLVTGAVLAGYAALSSNSDRTASAPSAGNGTPIAAAPDTIPVQPPAAIQPGATGPGTTVPPATQPIVPTQPPAAPSNTQVKPPAVTQPPAASTGTATTGTATTATSTTGTSTAATPPPAGAPKPVIVKFADDKAATTYDPNKRAGAEFGPAKNAIDKSPSTVWDVTTPVDGKPIGAGLMLDLGKPYALRALKIDTPTEGFTAEIYGAVSAKEIPEDLID
ncbi:MAG TPA: hypothetical protein VGF63_02435, partial [Solirubrobacteraceae bacterium]